MFYLILSIALLCAAARLWLTNSSGKSHSRLPPSPPGGWPLVGHVPAMSGITHPWRKWAEWGQAFEGLFTLNMAGQLVFVVTNARVAKALLEKHAASLADRPRLVVAHEIISDSRRVLLSSTTPKLRKSRQFMHQRLGKNNSFEHVQELEAKVLALNLLHKPTDFGDHCQLFASNVVLSIVYGIRCDTAKDRLIAEVVETVEKWVKHADPGAHLVDSFPSLNNLPRFLSPWQGVGEAIHAEEVELYSSLVEPTRRKMAAGQEPECAARYLLEQQKSLGLEDKDIIYILGDLLEAGGDTTTSALLALFMAACVNPAALAKAHAELDSSVGEDRMPALSDMQSLPYVQAMWQEVQRWRPSAPFAAPHLSSQDIDFEGFLLPKGAQFIGCTWAINRDTNVYGPDVDAFRPERFSEPSAEQQVDLMTAHGSTLFGFGRRICPGMHVAVNSMFISFATVLWGFNVVADPTSPIDVHDFSASFVSHANPFKCIITPRSAHRASIIHTAGQEALAELKHSAAPNSSH